LGALKTRLSADLIPQADRVERICDIVLAIRDGKELTAAGLDLPPRDFNYYRRAARILGLVGDKGELTIRGLKLADAGEGDRLQLLARAFDQSDVGKAWSLWSKRKALGDVAPASSIEFLLARSELAASTAKRRGTTLRRWLETLGPHLSNNTETARGKKTLAKQENLSLLPDDFVLNWASELPFHPRGVVKKLVVQNHEADPVRLAKAVDDHVQAVQELQRTNEFLDFDKCLRLARVCKALITKLGTLEVHKKQVALVAIHYFCIADDGEDDLGSCIGFDDDEVVMRSALATIGLSSLYETTP